MLEIVKTADGSNTIYNSDVDENYHSKHGALQESRHVFIKSGLEYFLDKYTEKYPAKLKLYQPGTAGEGEVAPPRGGGDLEGPDAGVSILEVGFGTGLNFLLSADYCADREIMLEYIGIEAYPLTLKMIGNTSYDQYTSPSLWESFIKSYQAVLRSPLLLNTACKLQIANCKLEDFQSAKQYDVIYFDAFAVARQPEMWGETAIAHTMAFLKPGGVFVTYAITGNLKRTLKALGCKVEKAPGAPGKREMLRAVKMEPYG